MPLNSDQLQICSHVQRVREERQKRIHRGNWKQETVGKEDKSVDKEDQSLASAAGDDAKPGDGCPRQTEFRIKIYMEIK